MDYQNLAQKFSLEGQTAVITGGARGIGKGLAMALAKAGANIVVVDLLEEEAKKTAALLASTAGIKAYSFIADLSRPHLIKDYVRGILGTCGRWACVRRGGHWWAAAGPTAGATAHPPPSGGRRYVRGNRAWFSPAPVFQGPQAIASGYRSVGSAGGPP